jgi:hypothetical protein
VIEGRLQPQADIDLHPCVIELDADASVRDLRCGDAFDLAQHALAVIDKRPREQLPLGVERDLVGALRRAEHCHDHAHDRNGDDDADRHHHAQAQMAPTELLFARLADIGSSCRQVPNPQGYLGVRIGGNDCVFACATPWTGAGPDKKASFQAVALIGSKE